MCEFSQGLRQLAHAYHASIVVSTCVMLLPMGCICGSANDFSDAGHMPITCWSHVGDQLCSICWWDP